MLKMLLFVCLLPFAFMEFFFYHQFGIVVVGMLYLGLAFQADSAAARYLTRSLGIDQDAWRREWEASRAQKARSGEKAQKESPSSPETEEIKVQPLRQPKYQAPAPPPEPRPAEVRRAAPVARSSSPNYQGRAHEVLAIPENAATRTIVNAFRFWIKKVHPDHGRGLPVEIANRRTQQIREAKEHLLERRRAKKAA